MPDWLLSGLFAGAVAGLIAYGGLRVELRYVKRLALGAHDRLDYIGAPAARIRDF